MVNLDERLKKIRVMVDAGQYFVVNRARQYGKTTMLWALSQYLQKDYVVISLSFQGLSSADFQDEYAFTAAFADLFVQTVSNSTDTADRLDSDTVHALENIAESGTEGQYSLRILFNHMKKLCKNAAAPVVLIIDEVDSASNNQIFMDFLAKLRDMYLNRKVFPTFRSVILAGVYDIKNLKFKIRPGEQHRQNSPWNVAADFDIDMSFSVSDIEGMLVQYEEDYHTGMDIFYMAQQIFDYTSGYPYLVSRICKLMDERICEMPEFGSRKKAWTENGLLESVKILLKEPDTLFDDMFKKLNDFPELVKVLHAVLFTGAIFPYNPDNYEISTASMFGFIKDENGVIRVANRLFETRLYNWFTSNEAVNSVTYKAALKDKNQFIQDGKLNMELVLQKFVEHFTDVYYGNSEKFVEENGRRLFLLYLRPIINGTGNYYIEARTRDMGRTDVVVDYRGEQYVIELKIYHGSEYNRRGEQQLSDYLESYHLEKGYMLSFNFNKKKTVGIKTVYCNGKTIVEAVV
ncbi:MAG: ATP-binding protein [Lachnospiraceae bacterium]|nr:ATP-binding protein [Lachnospiraceae bacterium]MDY4970422.1 ATP-binding protein [Lachnospiraceae bacterium]